MSETPVLDIADLHVAFDSSDGKVDAVRGVSLQVARGETVAVVGESGAGKSQIMMAAMGLLAANGTAVGSARFNGQELIGMPKASLDKIRGRHVTMIFQEPMTSLDPLYSIERQIAEPLMVHSGLGRSAARARVLELLDMVQIPRAAERLSAYPHELSGGQRQRVMIAMALANSPEILIADEPTTALDVTIQADILRLLAHLQRQLGMAILFITHDLGIVEAFADRVYVMRYGRIVESGPTAQVFDTPQNAYTRMLLDAEPEGQKAPVSKTAPVLLEARKLSVSFGGGGGFLSGRRPHRTAVQAVNLTLKRGQTLGIVGESGSGKSTLGRALLRLIPSSGSVLLDGTDISSFDRRAMRPLRRRLQMVFQDPYGALSPRLTVGEIITEGLLVHAPDLRPAERDAAAVRVLRDVDLDPAMRTRFPHEFSGGQRQRIAIARALIVTPDVLVLDEPTSALDRSVQKQLITLLRDLQTRFGMSYLFISHDLAVVRAISDSVMVMKDGQVLEAGATQAVFAAPQNDYTRALMRSAFSLNDVLSEPVA